MPRQTVVVCEQVEEEKPEAEPEENIVAKDTAAKKHSKKTSKQKPMPLRLWNVKSSVP
ncbi:MAG: hypothetical protein U1E91_02250 [Moraxella sp.]